MALNGYWNPWIITIDQSLAADGDLTDFDVLITRACLPDAVCSPTDVRHANADGSDLRFSSDADGDNLLPWDRIKFEHDSVDGAGDAVVILRVKVPSILQSGGATIYVHAGNSGATLPAADSEFGQYATYPATMKGYWPLCDDPTGASPQMRDRTEHQNHGICEGTVTSASTSTGGGVALSTGHIRVPDANIFDPGLNDFTISGRFKTSSFTGFPVVLMSKESGWNTGGWNVVLDESDGQLRPLIYGSAGNVTFPSGDLADGQRHSVSVSYDRDGNMVGVVDGAQVGTHDISSYSATDLSNALDLRFGVQADGAGNELSGELDSLRIEIGVLRDVAWAAARDRNESAPATYIAAGAQVVTYPPQPRITTPPQTMRLPHDLIW